jgi:hypothetical protein
VDVEPGQQQRSHGSCLKPVWEGTKFCQDHFLEWAPEDFAAGKFTMEELRRLFSLAASEQ